MRSYKVESLVLVPLRRGTTIVGYLYVINFDTGKVVEVKSLLELMSFILGSEIANHVLMNKLEYMSTTDALTGISNRHAMMQRISEIDDAAEHVPFGVLSIDLNGLKTVNDQQGHEAGDRMLIAATKVLRGIFRRNDLYRIGGDEFLVISTDISEDTFYGKLDMLHYTLSTQDEVSFSIGSFWTDGSESAHHAVNIADERMYADKRAFYGAQLDNHRDM
jgi:diguanylate cyclase (GGDEF)-like protein